IQQGFSNAPYTIVSKDDPSHTVRPIQFLDHFACFMHLNLIAIFWDCPVHDYNFSSRLDIIFIPPRVRLV
uniref:Uncharacterized protein n=1 Tax=Megaselia scalaris TaxID=36166 RepID=T1GL00_MEGSC